MIPSAIARNTTQVASLVAVALLLCSGCHTEPPAKRGAWHLKHSWTAGRYFRNQPLVIELCHAIEAREVAEIDRLVAAGADVNAKGLANMTPLMWAYPDNNLECSIRLLELGADPNVLVESTLNTGGEIEEGVAVTHLAVLHRDFNYFKAVFTHGGDPDLMPQTDAAFRDPPLIAQIVSGRRDKRERMRILIEAGANLNIKNSVGSTPAMMATTWNGQYGLALMLLKAGADMRAYNDTYLMQLMHLVLNERSRPKSSAQQADYNALREWMVLHGADFSQAQADLDRWKSWGEYSLERRSRLYRQAAEQNRKATIRALSGEE